MFLWNQSKIETKISHMLDLLEGGEEGKRGEDGGGEKWRHLAGL